MLAATEGAFDKVPLNKIALAVETLLFELNKKQSKVLERVNKGDKPSDEDNKVIVKIAQDIGLSYEEVDQKDKPKKDK